MRMLIGEYGLIVLAVVMTLILVAVLGQLVDSGLLRELMKVKADLMFL